MDDLIAAVTAGGLTPLVAALTSGVVGGIFGGWFAQRAAHRFRIKEKSLEQVANRRLDALEGIRKRLNRLVDAVEALANRPPTESLLDARRSRDLETVVVFLGDSSQVSHAVYVNAGDRRRLKDLNQALLRFVIDLEESSSRPDYRKSITGLAAAVRKEVSGVQTYFDALV